MKKMFINVLVFLIAGMSIFMPFSNGKNDVLAAEVLTTLDAENLEDGRYTISNPNFQFLNPYDDLTGVSGTEASEMAISMGTTIMNQFMGPSVTFEKIGSELFVVLTLNTGEIVTNMGSVSISDLQIFIEDSSGINTYSSVNYETVDSITIDEVEYTRIRFEIDSLDLIISPRYTAGAMSGFFINLAGLEITPTINKSLLAVKLAEARAINSTDFTTESFTALQTAITTAQGVYDSETITIEELNTQIDLLTAAVENLIELVDGEYLVSSTFQFLNPYDGLKVDGAPTNETATSAGTNIMNRVMGSRTSFERIDSELFVVLALNTNLVMAEEHRIENLQISIEDNNGSNTYSNVDYTTAGSVIIDGVEYERIRFKVSSLDLVIKVQYQMMNPTGFFVILNDTVITPIIDKTSLATKLIEARAFNSTDFTIESFTALQTAIITAQGVYDSETTTIEELNTQINLLTTAINNLVIVNTGLADGIYELPIELWHVTENRPSMVAASLNGTARIVVEDGVETMYIYIKAGTMGYIPGFQIMSEAGTYVNAQAMATDTNGNITSFSFLLESHTQYLNIKVITSAGTDQGMEARFKFDFNQLKAIDSNLDLNVAPQINDTITEPVLTSDSNNIMLLSLFATTMVLTMLVLVNKKRNLNNEKIK